MATRRASGRTDEKCMHRGFWKDQLKERGHLAEFRTNRRRKLKCNETEYGYAYWIHLVHDRGQ
jgi:hypothetical protein